MTPEMRGQPPRLVVMGVDRVAAGFVEDVPAQTGRLLGVVRRLAPGIEAAVVATQRRVEIVAVLPEQIEPETLLDEVLFATRRYAGDALSVDDARRLGVRVHRDTEAVRRIFRLAVDLELPAPGYRDSGDALRQTRDMARDAGTLGRVLDKTLEMALSLRDHARETTEAGLRPPSVADVAERQELVQMMVVAWGRWHRVLPDDTVAPRVEVPVHEFGRAS